MRVSLKPQLLLFGVLVAFLGCSVKSTDAQEVSVLPKPAPSAQGVSIQSRVIRDFESGNSQKEVFGKLVWVGGLELSSDEPLFGGLSGIAFVNPQRFIAIGDRGVAFSARLLVDEGRPVGIADANIKPLPGLYRATKGWQRDSESLAVVGDLALVSFEGDTRVILYDVKASQLWATRGRLKLSKDILAANKANEGLEALAVVPDGVPNAGAIVMFSEKSSGGMARGWIHRNGKIDQFSVPQNSGMSVTDAAFTANGDLLLLERSFSLLGGLKVRIRRIRAHYLKPGTIQNVEVLFRGGLSYELDNMEGIAIQDLVDGSSLITLVSDDNFAAFQRTLLLQFILPAGQ